MGIQAEENPAYKTTFEQDNFEIREYEPVLIARTQVQGNYKAAGDAAFKRLADYLFGNNTTQTKMDMTEPVMQEQKGEKMAMTAPVMQQQTGEGWEMQFVIPSKFTLESVPKPVNPEVNLEQLPARKVAVLVYRGRLIEKHIDAKAAELRQWVEQQGKQSKGEPQSAAYDPPWTIPMFRHNEIWIDLE